MDTIDQDADAFKRKLGAQPQCAMESEPLTPVCIVWMAWGLAGQRQARRAYRPGKPSFRGSGAVFAQALEQMVHLVLGLARQGAPQVGQPGPGVGP